MVDTTNTRISSKVVMLTVNVRLVERKEKSHVGRVIVMNVIKARSRAGIIASVYNKSPVVVVGDSGCEPVIEAYVGTPSTEAAVAAEDPAIVYVLRWSYQDRVDMMEII